MRRSESGSAILPLLGLSAITVLLLLPLLDLIKVAKHQANVLSQMVVYRAVLDSAVDYTIYGLRQRWCFSNAWLPDASCNMEHPRSSERILLNDTSLESFKALLQQNPGTPHSDPLVLDSIEYTLDLQTLTPAHPLYRLSVSARGAFHSILFEIRRVNRIDVPTRGREVTLEVKATLQAPIAIFKNLSNLSQTSTILVSPRELSRFALIVARDMHLDEDTTDSEDGDANFAHLAARGDAGAGLIFESPVFVNRDIILPPSQTNGFTPVTFAGRVQIGNGRILQGGNYLAPSSAGGIGHRFFNELPGFGGFLGGVDSDAVQDEGLNALISNTVLPPGTGNLQQCVEHNLNLTVLDRTKQSSLAIKKTPTGYLLGLNEGNMFVQQRQNQEPALKAGGDVFFPSTPQVIGVGKTVIGVRVQFLGNNTPNAVAEAKLSWDNRLIIPLPSQTRATGQTLEIITSRYRNHDKDQPFLLNLQVRTPNGTSILKPNALVQIRIKAFDVGVSHSKDVRSASPSGYGGESTPHATLDPNYSRVVTLGFQNDGGSLIEVPPKLPIPPPPAPTPQPDPSLTTVGATWMTLDVNLPQGQRKKTNLPRLNDGFDYAEMHNRCATSQNGGWLAFQPFDWGSSLTNSTRVSWNFANPTDESDGAKDYPSGGYDVLLNDITTKDFQVVSIAGVCRIQSSAVKVFGFFVCDKLIIEQRSSPLLIIGTIVAGSTNIHRSALTYGIRWRSIYHPQSVVDLREARILKPLPGYGTDCPRLPAVPFWSPVASVTEIANQRLCSPLYLRELADPFTWTTVDPDCGVSSADSSAVQCKRRPLRFLIKEVSRVSDV